VRKRFLNSILIYLNTQIELRTEKGQTEVTTILLRISDLSVAFIRKEKLHGAFGLLLLAHINGRFVCYSLCTISHWYVSLTSRWSFRDINPLTPELNPSAQRCLTRFFLLDVLLLEPCISFIYAWKTNKYTNYSFSLLIMYSHCYMLRHYIAIFRERS
jgi:hypothetical protein